jgi:predicted XRE-type DNA-binding protein
MTTKHRKDQTLEQYVAERYAEKPGLREAVDAMVAEMELEQDLVALREHAGLSQTALAGVLGVSQPAVAKLESADNVKTAKIETLARYVAALGGRLRVQIVPGPRKIVGLRRAK